MLDHITPVLLTYNEEQNVSRTLSRLAWAKDIVVVDSNSTDGTLAALRKFSNVRVFNRRFDSHAGQWRYAVEDTQITTDWILRLDADYQVSDQCQAGPHPGSADVEERPVRVQAPISRVCGRRGEAVKYYAERTQDENQ